MSFKNWWKQLMCKHEWEIENCSIKLTTNELNQLLYLFPNNKIKQCNKCGKKTRP